MILKPVIGNVVFIEKRIENKTKSGLLISQPSSDTVRRRTGVQGVALAASDQSYIKAIDDLIPTLIKKGDIFVFGDGYQVSIENNFALNGKLFAVEERVCHCVIGSARVHVKLDTEISQDHQFQITHNGHTHDVYLTEKNDDGTYLFIIDDYNTCLKGVETVEVKCLTENKIFNATITKLD